MSRLIPLFAFLLLTLSVISPAEELEGPWRVFAEEAVAHAEPIFESAEVARFQEGDMVEGEFLLNRETDEEWLVFDVEGETAHLSITTLHRIHPDNEW